MNDHLTDIVLQEVIAERDELRCLCEAADADFHACMDARQTAEAERDELKRSMRDIICMYDSPAGPPIEVMQVMVGIARSAIYSLADPYA